MADHIPATTLVSRIWTLLKQCFTAGETSDGVVQSPANPSPRQDLADPPPLPPTYGLGDLANLSSPVRRELQAGRNDDASSTSTEDFPALSVAGMPTTEPLQDLCLEFRAVTHERSSPESLHSQGDITSGEVVSRERNSGMGQRGLGLVVEEDSDESSAFVREVELEDPFT